MENSVRQQRVYYLLKITRNNTENYYSKGVPFCVLDLSTTTDFDIIKATNIIYQNQNNSISLKQQFILFQRLWKSWYRYVQKMKSPRNLLLRQLNLLKISFNPHSLSYNFN